MISNRRDALRILPVFLVARRSLLTIHCQLGFGIALPIRIEIQGGPPSNGRRLRRLKTTDMTYTENLWLYFTLLFGIIIVPGMDMLFVLANSLTRWQDAAAWRQRQASWRAALVHSLYGAIGVGILASLLPVALQPAAFRWRAAYMIWIGFTPDPQLDHRGYVSARRSTALRTGDAFRQRRDHLPHQSQGLPLHARCLSAVPANPIYGPIWLAGALSWRAMTACDPIRDLRRQWPLTAARSRNDC